MIYILLINVLDIQSNYLVTPNQNYRIEESGSKLGGAGFCYFKIREAKLFRLLGNVHCEERRGNYSNRAVDHRRYFVKVRYENLLPVIPVIFNNNTFHGIRRSEHVVDVYMPGPSQQNKTLLLMFWRLFLKIEIIIVKKICFMQSKCVFCYLC